MATAAQDQLYPFSSEKGTPIPLEIVRPLSAMRVAVAQNDETAVTLPDSYSLVNIFTTIDIVVDFNAALTYPIANATALDDCIILPSESLTTLAVPGDGSIRIIPANADEAGVVYINNLQKWAGIGLARQLGTK